MDMYHVRNVLTGFAIPALIFAAVLSFGDFKQGPYGGIHWQPPQNVWVRYVGLGSLAIYSAGAAAKAFSRRQEESEYGSHELLTHVSFSLMFLILLSGYYDEAASQSVFLEDDNYPNPPVSELRHGLGPR